MKAPAILLGVEVIVIGIAVLVLVGIGLVFFMIRSLSRLFRELRQSVPAELIRDLKEDFESGEFAMRAQEPVSLSGMERIYGPMIEHDFPELNLEELKQRAGRLALSTLAAVEGQDLAVLSESGDLYRDQVRQKLEQLKGLNQSEQYSGTTLHRTVLSHYARQSGTCRIQFQTALGAIYQKVAENGQIVAGGAGITQFKFETEALYVQGDNGLDGQSPETLAFNCPNCGAPIPELGNKHCQYCGAAVEPVNSRVWTFSSYSLTAY